MSYFNPQKYSESRSETEDQEERESQKENQVEEVEKGHKNITKVDIAKFDDLCKKFKEKKDLKIKKLVGQDKEDFNLIVSYVHFLYGTSYYNNLFDKVKKYFKNVNSVNPGTVGAYFAGCLLTKDDSNLSSGCSISCAGSMPLPKDEEGWSFCDKAVFLAEKGINGYGFSVVKPADTEEEMDSAYLFVESNSLHDFSGFSKSEKDQLRAFGCKKVKLIGYNNDLSYSELYKDAKPIHEIKPRAESHARSHSQDSDNSLMPFAILLILILLAIFIFLCYRYYKMRF